MEPKTLKDINWEDCFGDLLKNESYITESDLKKEAINHIQQMRKKISELTADNEGNFSVMINSNLAQINWIKYFFDIEEEEL